MLSVISTEVHREVALIAEDTFSSYHRFQEVAGQKRPFIHFVPSMVAPMGMFLATWCLVPMGIFTAPLRQAEHGTRGLFSNCLTPLRDGPRRFCIQGFMERPASGRCQTAVSFSTPQEISTAQRWWGLTVRVQCSN